jgi:hypothetical protein
MHDNVIDEIIAKVESILLRYDDMQKEVEKCHKELSEYYNYLYSIKQLREG